MVDTNMGGTSSRTTQNNGLFVPILVCHTEERPFASLGHCVASQPLADGKSEQSPPVSPDCPSCCPLLVKFKEEVYSKVMALVKEIAGGQ